MEASASLLNVNMHHLTEMSVVPPSTSLHAQLGSMSEESDFDSEWKDQDEHKVRILWQHSVKMNTCLLLTRI